MGSSGKTEYPLIEMPAPVGPENPSTAQYLTNRYADFTRTLSCPETYDPDTWDAWRRDLRAKLREVLRLDAWGNVNTPKVHVLSQVDCEGYTRQKVAYEAVRDNWVVGYLLVPHNITSPVPAALCLHGHVPGASLAVVDPDLALRESLGVAYGHELARLGFVVLAPDAAGQGERSDKPKVLTIEGAEFGQPITGCRLVFQRLHHMGLDLTGLRVFELMVGLNVLSEMQQVDASRMGCAGLSGGCYLSELLTALDDRIRAVILSGYFTTFLQTIWHGHCLCVQPFGIGEFCDIPDICALIAPRPQFIESGKRDPYFEIEPAFSIVRRVYRWLGAEQNLGLDRYDDGHMFHGEVSIDWIVRQLSAQG